MDQNFKGDNINYIGKLDSLGKDHKTQLKQLDYEEEPIDTGGEEKVNKFIAAQQKKKKLDEQMNPQKHLLPKDIFIKGDRSKKFDDKMKLPFPSIDVIFNHKNIWANLQNPNPKCIKFHLHKLEDWMPLITDPSPSEEHPRK